MPRQILVIVQTVGLLTRWNLFTIIAWYGHLNSLSNKPRRIAALISWGIALREYLLQVPAKRIDDTTFSLAQLKIMQEAITLTVFVPFALIFLKQPFKLD
jgi:uncharacterized protein (DUF486 family)